MGSHKQEKPLSCYWLNIDRCACLPIKSPLCLNSGKHCLNIIPICQWRGALSWTQFCRRGQLNHVSNQTPLLDILRNIVSVLRRCYWVSNSHVSVRYAVIFLLFTREFLRNLSCTERPWIKNKQKSVTFWCFQWPNKTVSSAVLI